MRPVGVKQNKRPPPQRLRVVSKARLVECWHMGPTVPSRAANNSDGDLFLLSAPRRVRETECEDGASGGERLTASFLLLLRHR